MFRFKLTYLLSAVFLAVLSFAPMHSASAMSADQREVRASSPLVQDVHWEWHHHHRFWVSDHYHHYRY